MKWFDKTVTELVKTLRKYSLKQWRALGFLLLIYLVPTALFVSIADEVREREHLPFDEPILHAIHGTSSAALDPVVIALTNTGSPFVLPLIVAALAGALLYFKKRRNALTLLVSVGGAALINIVLKALFQRDRPQLWERLVTENSYSFPSGHAMASSALVVTLILIFWNTRWRWWVVAVGVTYMLVIAYTRMYLGVHYPSDILAGWSISIIWVLLVQAIIGRWRRRAV